MNSVSASLLLSAHTHTVPSFGNQAVLRLTSWAVVAEVVVSLSLGLFLGWKHTYMLTVCIQVSVLQFNTGPIGVEYIFHSFYIANYSLENLEIFIWR